MTKPKMKAGDKAFRRSNDYTYHKKGDILSIVHVRCQNPKCKWPCVRETGQTNCIGYPYVIRFPNGDVDHFYNDEELVKITPMGLAIYKD